MTTLLTHIKRNAVAYLALFVALGGTSYAAIKLPAGSVGTKQLRKHAVTNRKLAKGAVGAADLDRKSMGAYVRAYAEVGPLGQLVASRPAAKVTEWRTSGPLPGGTIHWSVPISKSCFAAASARFEGYAPTASATAALQTENTRAGADVYVGLSAAEVPVSALVICPTK